MRNFPKPSACSSQHKTRKSLSPMSRPLEVAMTWEKLNTFTQKSSAISIFIDEVWPSTVEAGGILGGIGGIVWEGVDCNKSVLPRIPTHLRTAEDKMQKIPWALSNLLSCSRAFPFIFPFENEGVIPRDKYMRFVQNSICMLLGWLLPSEGVQCYVNVYLEHFDGANLPDGADRTELFEGIRAALEMTGAQGRFRRWRISEVKWVDKEAGYVPYGDLLAYLLHDNKYSRELFQTLGVQEWPGYVPLSLTTLSNLRDLDVSSNEGCFDVLFNLASQRRFRNCGLFHLGMNVVIGRAKSDVAFRNILLKKLEEAYLCKERQLDVLDAIATPILRNFSIDSLDDYPTQKLLRFLIELQDANHNGEPGRIQAILQKYEAQRDKLLQVEPILCLEMDLNRAVHYHDMFDFESGRQCLDFWMKRDLSLLPADSRGRLHSSYGQSCAFHGEYKKAESEFLEALRLFKEGGENYVGEIDQTAVYRAMNAIDSEVDREQVQKLVEEVLGCEIAKAVTELAPTQAKPYHHHLLVKFLWAFPEYAVERKNYLSYGKGGKWCHGCQHPWELILFYRGILCWEEHLSQLFEECFEKIDELYRQMRHGEILDFIYCFIAIGREVFLDSSTCPEIANMLKSLEKVMPKASPAIATLRNILDNNLVNDWEEFLRVLPFNYK